MLARWRSGERFLSAGEVCVAALLLAAPALATGPTCAGRPPTIVGGEGDNTLVGTDAGDVIYAGGGNDAIKGPGGGDTICGGAGNDHILGDPGNDRLEGGGEDTLTQ
jgi:Ca2+-binding RTX toxin-like protein